MSLPFFEDMPREDMLAMADRALADLTANGGLLPPAALRTFLERTTPVYTFRLHNARYGLSINIDIYADGVFTHETARVSCYPDVAREIGEQRVAELTAEYKQAVRRATFEDIDQ